MEEYFLCEVFGIRAVRGVPGSQTMHARAIRIYKLGECFALTNRDTLC
jgi:hypothetical protein